MADGNKSTPEAQNEITDPFAGAITISEVMTHNTATIMDEYGEFPDWIELFNSSENEINLCGYSLYDGSGQKWEFPECVIGEKDYLILFASGRNQTTGELHTSFALKDGERLTLYTPSGEMEDVFVCEESESDHSLQKTENGTVQTVFATPGFKNDMEGYESWQNSRTCSGPVIINEAISANVSHPLKSSSKCEDWIELKNISDKTVDLSNYYLSDDFDDLKKTSLSGMELKSMECIAIGCSDFGLNARSERIYLSDGIHIIDYLPMIGIPSDYSIGRLNGQNGIYYFSEPTPGAENAGGCTYVSALPEAVTSPGIYNDVTVLSVELDDSKGILYYTLDGSTPTEKSPVYSEPIVIEKTTTVRVRSVEENAAISKTATFNYIVNENHTLPVLCFSGDNLQKAITAGTVGKNKEKEINISFYEESGSFSADAGLTLSGVTGSLTLAKKSFKVHFRDKYGNSLLNYDLFDSEINCFSSLTVRSGQDGYNMVFQNALWENLCLDMNGSALTLNSRFCILYINGEYMGIYDLKEDLSKDYYASHAEVKSKTVESEKFPVSKSGNFYQEVIRFCLDNDLSVEENYNTLCSRIDIDSFIDWFIIEGVSSNIDLYHNVRVFRSTEKGNKWQFAFFDIDLVKYSSSAPFAVLFGHSEYLSEQARDIVLSVCENASFREKLFSRYSELYDTVLSTDSILSKIDSYQALLEPEILRNCKKWGTSRDNWYKTIDYTKRVMTECDWENACVDNLLRYMQENNIMSQKEADAVRLKYFS